ncbi:LysR family transcriptional regulator [Paraburkholderia susongensis]|uniref:Transcriptional regulator, LysR family n=1 Tax=Paraburkholderia susongensis TaxID=1515439 RepID=A0A1X7LIN8_9BURK|nr:LysR family transcriptional regulator [Paraburkholderia susongensis]SMG53193.1 transcriptional regulator, LysR family [Paraburkholderia susongensis]
MAGLNERRLHYFYEAMTAGSMRAAAERLGVEASVISRQIQLLEKELNVTLVERRGRGVAPTDGGRLVLEVCEERRVSEEALRLRLDELLGLERGDLSIVTGPGFINELMSNVLRGFCERYPGVHVHLEATDADDVVARVIDDRAHVGLTTCPPPHPAVRVVGERHQPICAIAAAGHPLERHAGSVSLADAAQFPLALARDGTGLGSLTQQAAAIEGIRLEPAFTANSIEALKQFVSMGLGVTFMSAFSVGPELANGTLIARRTTNAVFEGARARLFVRAGRRFSAATRAWLDWTRQVGMLDAQSV